MKLNRVFLFALCCGFSLVVHGQDRGAAEKSAIPAPNTSGQLLITGSNFIPFSGAPAGKARCDADGNIYVHLVNSDTASQYHKNSKTPVLRVRPDGSLSGSYKITDAAVNLSAMDFFVSHSGEVFAAASSSPEPGVYIVGFSQDGSVRSTIKLIEEFFVPYQIAAFPSGEFLLSGTIGPENRKPYTAVFDLNGRVIRQIYEPEDEDSRKKALARDPDFHSEYTNSGNTAVWHGDVALGSDGNAYLLRATSPALIYVINSKGAVLRKLRVDSPSSGLIGQRLTAGTGRLAISFLERGSNMGVIKVVDLAGNSIASFSTGNPRMYPGLLSCYAAHTFTFMSMDQENPVSLEKAEPR